jgi:hypothetical protein
MVYVTHQCSNRGAVTGQAATSFDLTAEHIVLVARAVQVPARVVCILAGGLSAQAAALLRDVCW